MVDSSRAVLAVAIVACGGGQHAAPGGGAMTGSVKTYQPLGIKDDAKAPSQAVILGTDDKNGSTVLKLPAAGSKASVDAMFVKLGNATPSGGITPVTLSTAPNGDGPVQVGIVEEMSGGTGPQWRAGVWVSAFVAATTLGKDLTDFKFTASSGGFIDGASASGLMAGGFLAAMTGVEVDPTATMTGIINPDGTIGPVAGIPEKFLGSIDKGKKRLGYPIGMRYAKSEATGQMVDLVGLANEHHVQAIEIATVHDAYKLLTGKQLPEAVPVAETEMALDEETNKALDAKYKDWQKRLGDEWSTILQLTQSGRLPAGLATLAKWAQERAAQAEKLHAQGLYAAAYARILFAWVAAASANDTYKVLSRVQAGDIPGAIAQLGELDQLDRQTTDVFKRIGAIKPSTLGGHLQMISAFQAALRGWGFKMFASDNIKNTKQFLDSLASTNKADLGSPQIADAVVNTVAPTVLLIGKTVAETALASQVLEFETEKSVNYMCNIVNVKRMSTSFQSASAAGLNYFDTLLIQPLAQQVGMSEEQAKMRVAMVEPDYLVAMMTSHLPQADGLPQDLRTSWGEKSLPWGLMSLAGNELAYFETAALITKHYSLGVHTDSTTGRPDQVEHDKAFQNMLSRAERVARASARAARIATGSIPVQAKLAYQLATIERDGDLGDKLDALAEFWNASAYSQTAVALARN
jgi:hypothetical protein